MVAKETAGGLKGYSVGNLSLTRKVPFYCILVSWGRGSFSGSARIEEGVQRRKESSPVLPCRLSSHTDLPRLPVRL